MIGTNGIYFMGRHQETANTTPRELRAAKEPSASFWTQAAMWP